MHQAIKAARAEGIPLTEVDFQRIVVSSVKAVCEYVNTPEGQQQTGNAGLSMLTGFGYSFGHAIKTHLSNNRDNYSIGIGAVGVSVKVFPMVWERTAQIRTRGLQFVPENIKKNRFILGTLAVISLFRGLFPKNPSAGDAGAVAKKGDDILDAITGK